MGKDVLLLSVMFIIIISSFAGAQEYYADLIIDVQTDGSVKISGITNDEFLSPGNYQTFTSKKGIYWLLNISSDKKFSDYILTVRLPEGAEFNYLKTEGRSRVSYDDGIKIVASGSESLNLIIQYRVEESKTSILYFWLLVAVIGLLALGFFSWKRFMRKLILKNEDLKTKEKSIEKIEEEVVKNRAEKNEEKLTKYHNVLIVKKTLAENQEKIIDLLIEAGGSLVQKQLQHRLNLPKATLSRNLDILAKKGIIAKQSRGMTNMITLNRDFDSGK